MADTPLVSIGLPVYNGIELVRRALDSLLAQDYPNFELIVSDNVSTDGTWEVLQEYAARDARIKLYRNARNVGAAANFCRVYELATGFYFMWAAHDDWWEPSFVSTCVSYMQQYPATTVCYAGELVFAREGRREFDHPETWRRVRSLLETIPGVIFYGLYRRDALRPAMPPPFVGPDIVTLMQMALAGPIGVLPQQLHHFTLVPRTTKIRLQQMGHRVSVFTVLKWDATLFWTMLRLSQRAASNLRTRWLLLKAMYPFMAFMTAWPHPVGLMKRYSTLMSDSTYEDIASRLERYPRLVAVLRRVTGLKLRSGTSPAQDQPVSDTRPAGHEREA